MSVPRARPADADDEVARLAVAPDEAQGVQSVDGRAALPGPSLPEVGGEWRRGLPTPAALRAP